MKKSTNGGVSFAGTATVGESMLVPALWLGVTVLTGAGLAFLAVVLIPGVGYEVNGATRWVRIGVMNLQVSEPARLCILLYVAGYTVRQQKALRESFVGFLRPMLVLSLCCALLLAEPDFGAAIVLLATALVMLFVAGARIRDFLVFTYQQAIRHFNDRHLHAKFGKCQRKLHADRPTA